MPISRYKMVQTIGNKNPGGDREGLLSCRKVSILFEEIRPDTAPVIRGIAMHISNVLNDFCKSITSHL